jgi:hypothetical protein
VLFRSLYYLIEDSPQRNVRFCSRCRTAAEWKRNPFDILKLEEDKKWVWMLLVGRTKFGAKKFLEEIKHLDVNKGK